jgi:hypothetical protein
MDTRQFWDIVAAACELDATKSDAWADKLKTALMKLPPNDIVEWNHIFDRLAARAYTVDLWGAAYLINGGASDDGYYYFRCWLIGMGRKVYEAALANPDSLADVVRQHVEAEAEIYAAAHQAWIAVTGHSDTDPYPARNETAELQGETWDFDDSAEVRRRMPRLAAKYHH